MIGIIRHVTLGWMSNNLSNYKLYASKSKNKKKCTKQNINFVFDERTHASGCKITAQLSSD